MNEAKPFVVEKRVVMESWLQVKANRGSAGIDGIDLKSYESKATYRRICTSFGTA